MRKTAACLLPCAIAGLLFTVALRADEITPHDLAALKAKLREAVEAGRLTKKQAAVKFRVITEGHTQTMEKNDVVSVDSRSLPTTSTAGDTEGTVATGFFGWAAEATHRFMDNSHLGEPRLIQGLSFRLDHRDHDSIGREWENITIRIAHGDWSSIRYNASKEFSLVDEPTVVFSKPWSFPTLKGLTPTEPAEWGGPQNALSFSFDEPFAYNGEDAIYVEFVFAGGVAADGRPWTGDLPFGFEYFLDSMPESGGWRVAQRPVGLFREPRVEAVVSYTAGWQSVWTSSPKGMPFLKWDFVGFGE